MASKSNRFLELASLFPSSALSRAVGAVADSNLPAAVHQTAIKAFAASFGINTEEAELPLAQYPTLEAFFTRRLKPGVRLIAQAEDAIVSPVDARVAAVGRAKEGRLIQAKGQDYSLAELLGESPESAEQSKRFYDGAFVTLYLSPKDYHRIHVPFDGQIESYRYIPGKLFPVNSLGVKWVPNLFCTNERLVTFLNTGAGHMAVVKVGALNVGRIRASYDNVVTNIGRAASSKSYEQPIAINKGDELGVFELGSTVILLLEPGRAELNESLVEGATVKMGESIGRAR